MVDSVRNFSRSLSTNTSVATSTALDNHSVMQFTQVLSAPPPSNLPDLNTPQGFTQWREKCLQTTGKTALDNKDYQALAAQTVTNLNQKTNSETYSMTGVDHAAMAVQDAYNNSMAFYSYAGATPEYDEQQFLKQLPDDYYRALIPATGQQLNVADMKALIEEYAQLQPQYQNPTVKARLDEINQKLNPYREAYNHQYAKEEWSESGISVTYADQRLNYRFETSQEAFKAEVSKDIKISSPQGGHYVAGGELLAAIAENTQHGHTAGADNNKNGAFDPTKDRHGLSGFVNGFIENVIDNPVIRTVAQIAQFTPLTPVATIFNTVAAAHDTIQAAEDGNITKALASAAGAVTGTGKLTGSTNIANTASALRDIATVATVINDPKNAMLDITSAKVANYIGHGDNGNSPFGNAKPIAHGIAQGVFQEARGGEFVSGFTGAVAAELGANVNTMSGIAQRTALSGLIGGLAAEISGGDFQDGARAAAITHVFNDEMTYFDNEDGWVTRDHSDPRVPSVVSHHAQSKISNQWMENQKNYGGVSGGFNQPWWEAPNNDYRDIADYVKTDAGQRDLIILNSFLGVAGIRSPALSYMGAGWSAQTEDWDGAVVGAMGVQYGYWGGVAAASYTLFQNHVSPIGW
ncbi:hypothetical protein [Thiothrix fructosivorans]|uniref:Uncharacterized protein n=1 Tax=Thiothrix fructosivorans TaxID=111770 RepID=A0A8B0SM78_9GAMM|nr:hypothetical protein [Thiothrix fructosivorans]MBO0613411.1 hypothetical protein [Thiothrix fructosivorans]QTX11158.1 hypothetical protein J1836_001960 [Thiothrix fructosivorans]